MKQIPIQTASTTQSPVSIQIPVVPQIPTPIQVATQVPAQQTLVPTITTPAAPVPQTRTRISERPNEDYLTLVGNLKLRGDSLVQGNSVVYGGNFVVNNAQGNPVAAITNSGDLLLKGNVIFGTDPNSSYVLGAQNDKFAFQKYGQKGFSIDNNGNLVKSESLLMDNWRIPKL